MSLATSKMAKRFEKRNRRLHGLAEIEEEVDLFSRTRKWRTSRLRPRFLILRVDIKNFRRRLNLIPRESEHSVKQRKKNDPDATTSGAISTPALEGVPDLFPQLGEQSPDLTLTHPATGEKTGPTTTNGDLEAQRPAPTKRHQLREDDSDDDSDDDDDDDDDQDEHAFDHPSTYIQQTWIWVPKDPLGLSDMLVYDMKKIGVDASDKGATIDDRGVVEASRGPPDEDWSGGQDN